MTDIPAAAKQLADSGGWAAFLVLCAVLGIGFVRGWYVPGYLYREMQARSEKLVEQLDRNTDTLKRLASATERALRRDRGSGPDAAP